MLEKVDLTKKLSKEESKEIREREGLRIGKLQRECREAKIPVMIVFEGLDAAGKGSQIGELIQNLDPRGYQVYAISRPTEDERLHPSLWRFWNKIPAAGRVNLYDSSWYSSLLTERFDGITPENKIPAIITDINSFERQLTDGGYVIIKLFLHISKKEQKKRFDDLLAHKETKWRVSEGDLKRNKHYDEYLEMAEEMLEKTDSHYAGWTIIEATDREYAAVKILSTVANRLDYELKKKQQVAEEAVVEEERNFKIGALNTVDLSKKLEREEYKKRLKALQNRLTVLHNELYLLRIPVVLGFEGWDAGGKGGAIKRLTQALDARGYEVHPTSSPNDVERAHHYLWRFWTAMPKDGHVAIFDRTWYGRVMVERIEGFCSTSDWKRAYQEINEMESHLVNSGAVVIKFWLQIDKDEQERRFKERQENPDKQWKITEEDWRNRAKWDAYEEAVNEMLVRTSTVNAPWVIVEGNDKYYARVKVLETVVDALERKVKEVKKSREKD